MSYNFDLSYIHKSLDDDLFRCTYTDSINSTMVTIEYTLLFVLFIFVLLYSPIEIFKSEVLYR